MKKCFLFILLAIILADCVPVEIDSVQTFSKIVILSLFALFAFTALVLGSLALVMVFRFFGLWFCTSRSLFANDDESEPVLFCQKPETSDLYKQMDSDQAWLFSKLLSSNHDEADAHGSSGVDWMS